MYFSIQQLYYPFALHLKKPSTQVESLKKCHLQCPGQRLSAQRGNLWLFDKAQVLGSRRRRRRRRRGGGGAGGGGGGGGGAAARVGTIWNERSCANNLLTMQRVPWDSRFTAFGVWRVLGLACIQVLGGVFTSQTSSQSSIYVTFDILKTLLNDWLAEHPKSKLKTSISAAWHKNETWGGVSILSVGEY